MNIYDKVLQLNKYCGMNDEHSYMYDERIDIVNYNIQIPEEEIIKKKISIAKVFVLTGDAGEGKSRMIRNIIELLDQNKFKIISDFSESNIQEKKDILLSIKEALLSNVDKKYFIAANMGVLSEAVLKFEPSLFEWLQLPPKELVIINFEKRNLADNRAFFKKLVTEYYNYNNDESCYNDQCKYIKDCPYRKNIDCLLKDKSIEAIRLLCEASYMIGNHITLRELLSLLSFLVTFGKMCQNANQVDDYYNFFAYSNRYDLIKKFIELDPANVSDSKVKAKDPDEYVHMLRAKFFEDPIKEKLGAKYLLVFYNITNSLNQKPYFFEYTEATGLFADLKVGISKLISKNSTSTEISLFDTPSNIGAGIKTKFTLKEGVALFFGNDVLNIFNANNVISNELRNSFYLGYTPSENQTIKLKFDYTLFDILMRIKDDYYIEHLSSYGKDYGISNFFRKALNTTEGSYNDMTVVFNEKFNQFSDFQMIKFNKSSLLPGVNNTTKVKIKLIGG